MTTSSSEQFDVVVIGGGTAGLVTASGCARLGRKVALIDREKLGGDCLWTGCVPTKALVASAKLVHQMANAQHFGIEPHHVEVSPRRIMESMREARHHIEPHDDPQKFRALGIDVIEGSARLVGRNEVDVNGRRLRAKDIVLATGSRTAVPPIEGLAESGYLDHASFLQRDEFPRSVIILGGGYIGVEFAQILRRFGSDVTVVEMGDVIAPREDADVIETITAVLRYEGVRVLTGWKATAVRVEGEARVMTIERGAEREQLRAEAIFVASGRRGNIEDLGLEDAGVATDRTYVRVDEHLETSVPHIWACGDIHGGLQFTHVAAYEAVTLVRNMLFPGKSKADYSHIPWALYTDPEAAHLGLTEREARARYGENVVRVYKVDMDEVDRAVVDRSTAGFIKIICDDSGTILGAHVVCSNASTVIEEIVLARRNGLKVSALAQRVSSYPSFADGVGKAAALYYAELAGNWKGALARRIAALTH
jgi:pyruvate/2-oxoglutarate dehydrogenase complex dihydrolipoamide dehydrogenase (E3) component